MTISSAARATESPAATAATQSIADIAAEVLFDLEAWAHATAEPGHWFDEAAAARACEFFPRYLRHTKGQWAGQPFVLDPWQRMVVRTAFGWKRASGTRRFRACFIAIARKNGKTTFAAGLALYLTFADGEAGAEVYSAANDKDQAAICFSEAARMRAQSPALTERSHVFKHALTVPASWSSYKVLSSDANTKDGLNAHGVIYDEFHALRDRLLYDVLHTSIGTRQQPMEIIITTAGADPASICAELWDYARAVRAGEIKDPEFLPVLFAADKDDPIDDPRTWAKANPNLGRSISVEYLRKEVARARQMPRYENVFKRLHLNQWTAQTTRWLPMDKWDEVVPDLPALGHAPGQAVPLAHFAGRRCWGGLDLSSTTDITALVLAFPREPKGFALWAHFWLPAANLDERMKRDRADYAAWARDGWLTLTEGNVVDYDLIRRTITGGATPDDAHAVRNMVDLAELAIDRWNATQLTTQLTGDGVTVVPFGQGFASMSAPAKALEAAVLDGVLDHGGNPVLRWMADNVAIATDAAGNIKPDKAKSHKRIDGVVATIMALGRLTVSGSEAGGKSWWEEQGAEPATA